MEGGIIFKPGGGKGGAHTYVQHLAEWFDIPVYVSYSDLGQDGWNGVQLSEFGERQKIPLIGRRGIGDFLDRLEYAFWTPPKDHDVIISSGLITKAVQHRPKQTRIHLAHGFHRGAFGLPPRSGFSKNAILEILQKINRLQLRQSESHQMAKMDYVVANSEFTADMLNHYLNVEADTVINPPVPVQEYYNTDSHEEFYFFVGRIAEVKGIRQIVEAFDRLPYKLVVAGDGPLREELERKSSDNIEFLGYVTEEKKKELFAKSFGFIQNSIIEDFGITTVEALASGTPVIARDHQNNSNLVSDGETGILFNSEKPVEGLIEAVYDSHSNYWNHNEIQEQSRKYGTDISYRKWENFIDEVISAP